MDIYKGRNMASTKIEVFIFLLFVFLFIGCNKKQNTESTFYDDSKTKIELPEQNKNGYQKYVLDGSYIQASYDSYNVYYSIFEYENKKYIKDYYFSGSKDKKEDLLFYVCLKNIEETVCCLCLDKTGKEISKTKSVGDLVFEEKSLFKNHEITILGFSEEVLKDPMNRQFYYLRDNVLQKDSFWPLEYNNEKQIVTEFVP